MTITIDHMGPLGDGVARTDDGPLYVPFTLPGEAVMTDGAPHRAALVSVVTPSTERVAPICRHFGTCGGCAMQHWQTAPYLEWKRSLVASALAKAGVKGEVEPVIAAPPHSRRRATFTAKRGPGGIELGFLERASDRLVDIEVCPVMLPAIEKALPDLKALAATLLRGSETLNFAVMASDTGLDLDVSGGEAPNADMLAAFVRAAARGPVLRGSVDGEIVYERATPTVAFGTAKVTPAPGAFLQAVASSEEHMGALVCAHLAGGKRLADLFAGSGTFALRLAQKARVLAVESEASALASLDAANRAPGGKPIKTERRDLFDAPLRTDELDKFDGVCLDPPRAGAEAQCAELARSTVPKIAYVSCNPLALGRDLRVLVDGGYTLKRVVPLDQFVFSHHVEVVALLEKPVTPRKRSIFAQR